MICILTVNKYLTLIVVNERRKILKTIAENLLIYIYNIYYICVAYKPYFIIELSRYDRFQRYSEEHEKESNYGQTDDLAYFESALCGYGRSRVGAKGRGTDC